VLATAGAAAQGQPTLGILPQEGPPGTIVTITGEGFVPGDAVYIETFPGTASDHGTIRLMTVTPDDSGRFSIILPMPPEGLENLGRIGGPLTIFAYPHSFGNRTTATVGAAPKAVFALTVGAPPPSGLGALGDSGKSGQLGALFALCLGAAFAGAAAIAAFSARRTAA